MGIKSWLIRKLESDIDLATMDMPDSDKPKFINLKKRLLNSLRGTKQITDGTTEVKVKNDSKEEFRNQLRVEDNNENKTNRDDKHTKINETDF